MAQSQAEFCQAGTGSGVSPECAAEFAAIAANYEHLRDRLDRLDTTIVAGLESLRAYLKDEYSQSIDHRISALASRLEAAERKIASMQETLDGLSKKILYATGGIAMLTFLIGLAVSLLPKLLGGR